MKLYIGTIICSQASELSYAILQCAGNSIITDINFASFGTATGSCDSGYSYSSCNSANSMSIVQTECLGKSSCSVLSSNSNSYFGDPCSGVPKTLTIQATCTTYNTSSHLSPTATLISSKNSSYQTNRTKNVFKFSYTGVDQYFTSYLNHLHVYMWGAGGQGYLAHKNGGSGAYVE